MDFQLVEEYIDRLPYTDAYTELDLPLREKLAFSASEMLRRRFPTAVINDEMVALQALYIAKGEGEEFMIMKEQGVKSFTIEGMSFTFDGTMTSPEVAAMIDFQLNPPKPPRRSGWGRLV